MWLLSRKSQPAHCWGWCLYVESKSFLQIYRTKGTQSAEGMMDTPNSSMFPITQLFLLTLGLWCLWQRRPGRLHPEQTRVSSQCDLKKVRRCSKSCHGSCLKKSSSWCDQWRWDQSSALHTKRRASLNISKISQILLVWDVETPS